MNNLGVGFADKYKIILHYELEKSRRSGIFYVFAIFITRLVGRILATMR
jgi:hypothetical protein